MPKLPDLKALSLPSLPAGHTPSSLWATVRGMRAVYLASQKDLYFSALVQMQRDYNVLGWVETLERDGAVAEGTAEKWREFVRDRRPLAAQRMTAEDPIIKLRDSACMLNPASMSRSQLTGCFKHHARVPFNDYTIPYARQTANGRAKKLGGKFKAVWINTDGEIAKSYGAAMIYEERTAGGRGDSGANTMQPMDAQGAQLYQTDLAWAGGQVTAIVSSPLYRFNAQAWAIRQYHLKVADYWNAIDPGRGREWAEKQPCPILGPEVDFRPLRVGMTIAEHGVWLAQQQLEHMTANSLTVIRLPFFLPSTVPLPNNLSMHDHAPGSVLVKHHVHTYPQDESAKGKRWPIYNPWHELEPRHRDADDGFASGGTRIRTFREIVRWAANEAVDLKEYDDKDDTKALAYKDL